MPQFFLYLFVPLIAMVLSKVDVKLLRVPAIVVALCIFTVPAISAVLQTWGYEPIDSWLSLEFGGGIYGSILISEYLLKKGMLKIFRSSWLAIICRASGAVLICSACIFECFSRVRTIFWKPVIQCLAKCSFGIYLIHNIFVTLGLKYVTVSSEKLKIPVVWVLTFAISWLIVWLLGKNKVLARLLFFIRS